MRSLRLRVVLWVLFAALACCFAYAAITLESELNRVPDEEKAALAWITEKRGAIIRKEPKMHITHVYLEGLDIGGEELKTLASLSRLEHLDLSNTEITDADLRYLQPIISLRSLELSGTAVTDAGLPLLMPLHNLEVIHGANTSLTVEAVVRLLFAETPGPPHETADSCEDPPTGDPEPREKATDRAE